MSDQAMDPCECISQEFAMRRLLNLLRQTQSYCTDTECLDEFNRSGNDASFDNVFFMTLVIGFAMVVYFLRPRSSRYNAQEKKITNNNQGPQPPPDAPIN